MSEDNQLESESESDDDYIPSEEEALSEAESGSESDVDDNKEKTKTKKPQKVNNPFPRKRKGGIRLADAADEGEVDLGQDEDEPANEKEGQIVVQEKQEINNKKKADDLWADFLKDVSPPGRARPAVQVIDTPLPQDKTSTLSKVTTNTSHTTRTMPANTEKVTITQVFDFAGEEVKVTKEVDAESKEAKQLTKSNSEANTSLEDVPKDLPTGLKRSGAGGGGLGSLLGKLNKKPKIGTLEKSALDWDSFKKKEGIQEELEIHNRGKSGYLERKAFLERTDLRQFEIEKNLRQGKR